MARYSTGTGFSPFAALLTLGFVAFCLGSVYWAFKNHECSETTREQALECFRMYCLSEGPCTDAEIQAVETQLVLACVNRQSAQSEWHDALEGLEATRDRDCPTANHHFARVLEQFRVELAAAAAEGTGLPAESQPMPDPADYPFLEVEGTGQIPAPR